MADRLPHRSRHANDGDGAQSSSVHAGVHAGTRCRAVGACQVRRATAAPSSIDTGLVPPVKEFSMSVGRMSPGRLFLAALSCRCLAGCTNPYDPGQRAVGGGLLGAGAGAAIGGIAGGGKGAAIGALAGGALGAVGGAATTPAPPPPAYGYGYAPPPPPAAYGYAPRPATSIRVCTPASASWVLSALRVLTVVPRDRSGCAVRGSKVVIGTRGMW